MKYTNTMSDLRELRTRKLIFQGFNNVLSRKLFSRITINDIADAALIHRNTFYHHFTDKYDLLNAMLTETLRTLLTDQQTADFSSHPFATIHKLYADHFQKLFKLQVNDKQFTKIVWQKFLRELIKKNNGDKNFWAIGGFSVIMDWNEINGHPYDFFEDYQHLDQIYQSHHFPKLSK